MATFDWPFANQPLRCRTSVILLVGSLSWSPRVPAQSETFRARRSSDSRWERTDLVYEHQLLPLIGACLHLAFHLKRILIDVNRRTGGQSQVKDRTRDGRIVEDGRGETARVSLQRMSSDAIRRLCARVLDYPRYLLTARSNCILRCASPVQRMR